MSFSFRGGEGLALISVMNAESGNVILETTGLKMLKFAKETQVRKRGRRSKKAQVPEALIQRHTDDVLAARLIENLRVDDEFWIWARYQTPYWRRKLAGMFKSLPDNTCWIPISEKYSLCLHLELKTTVGKHSQGQKKKARVLPWVTARTMSEVTKIIDEFVEDAKRIRGLIEEGVSL